MTKQLLNLHTIQKITLIFTTLLLLPMSSSAGTFSTQGNTITSNGSQYSWGYGGGSWTITTTNATLSSPLSNSLTTSESGFKSGGYIKLSTTRPIDTDTKLRIIRIQGSCDGCTFSFRFQKKDGTFTEEYQIERNESEYLYAFGEPLEWGEGKSLEITISSNNDNASCSISNIIFHTKDCSDVTYEWPNTPTSEYDISGIQRRTGTDEVIFEGHCMNKTVFSFALEPQTTVTNPKITYTSSNTQVAVVDEQTGKVTVNGSGSTTITATPVETDDVYYNPASYSYTLNITSLDDNLGLIVGGITVNSTNKGNITGDGSISYDEDNKTLTLNNATLTSSIISYLDKLTIDIQGNNTITTNGEPAIKTTLSDSYRDLIIESTSTPLGSLILKNTKSGENCGGVVSEKFSIALQGSVKLLAPYYGDGCIKMDSTHVASFGESYNLAIDMVRVGNTNATDIFGNHKASYDKDKHTLTLNGISINNNIERTSAEDLTIALNGENSITVSSGAAISGAVAAGVDIQPTLSFVLADGASNAKLTMTNGANDVSSVSGFTWYESDSGFYVLREYGETTKKTIITSTIFSGGNGTKDSPFIISSLQDFKDFVHYMNDRDGVNPPICMAYFKLEGDIDCSEFTDFTPINGGDMPFMGSFDGNGKTISNITFSTPYTSANVGLFESVRSSGVVKNLTLSNCSFTGGVCTGSIASYLEGTISNCNINNCTISTGNAQSPTAGGIAGEIYGGTIENCKISGTTVNAQPTGDADWISGNNGVSIAGGIVGKLLSSETISSCEVNNSNIFASHPNSIDNLGAGGIVGVCMSEGIVSNNTVKGTTKISSNSLTEENRNKACAGAIVGKKGSVTFTNNTYEFSVTTEEAETNTQSEPTTKSEYVHRGIGEKTYNDLFQTYDNTPDIFDNSGAVLANIKKMTLNHNNAEGEIWLKDSYQRDLGEGVYEDYIVSGQEAIIGVSISEPYSVASFTATTSKGETISTRLDNEAIGDEVPAYIFTMPNDDVTVSAVFGIDIANASISLDQNQTEFTYTGGKKSPIITSMVIAEKTESPEITPSYSFALTSDDYDISYKIINGTTETDINANDIVNVGAFKMILKGKGNYYGTKEIPFQIKKQAISGPITITLSASSLPYNGEVQKPTITEVSFTQETVDSGEPFKVTTTSYDATYSDGFTNVGTYTVNISLTGNYSGEGSTSFTITKATITPTVTLEGWTYGATANEPSVTGNSGSGVVSYAYKLQHAAEEAYSDTKPTNAGTYTVKASIAATANYEAATDSAHFTIAKAAGGLTYSAATASAELNGDGWTAPNLDNPNKLTVTYTSSNTAVATISETGIVTLVGTGEATIKAASDGDANHEASEAQYVLTVTRGRALGYGVWIGDIEVNEDNLTDILEDGVLGDDGEYTKAPSFIFNPEENTLLVINSNAELTIESRMPELKIHLSNDNKLKKVFYNNIGNPESKGTLLFTCDSNYPGSVTIGNTAGESAITGFSSVGYEFNLQALKPEKAKYANGQMTDSLGVVADTITVGVPLEPIKSDDKEELNADDFTVTNPDGSTATVDLSSTNVNNIYYTLPESTEGQGYDPETNTISVVDPMTDEAVEQIAAATTSNSTTVGSNDYAENFIGLTFIVQGGEGVIRIDQETEDGYEFHLKIGDSPSITLKSGKEEIAYSLPDATYCWLYLVKSGPARATTRVGKRDHIPGNIRLVSVKANAVASTKPVKTVSGGTISPAVNIAITGIVEIEKDTPENKYDVETVNDKWYTIDGRPINKPSQKGIYIRNRKKVVVK